MDEQPLTRFVVSLYKPHQSCPHAVYWERYPNLETAVTQACEKLIVAGLNPGYATPICNPAVITVEQHSIVICDPTTLHRTTTYIAAALSAATPEAETT
jgi:hypothetical protein